MGVVQGLISGVEQGLALPEAVAAEPVATRRSSGTWAKKHRGQSQFRPFSHSRVRNFSGCIQSSNRLCAHLQLSPCGHDFLCMWKRALVKASAGARCKVSR